MNPASNFRTFGSERKFRYTSYTIVFLMMSCVVLTLSILIHNLLPDWHSGMIAGMLLFIVVDRLYTFRQFKSLTPFSSEWVISFGVQWIVIVFFGRFLLSYADGPDALVTDLALLARGYFLDLITPEFVITLMLAFAAWELTTQFLELLDEIGLDMRVASHGIDAQVKSDDVPSQQRMVNLIFGIGIALVILTALSRINLRTIVTTSTGLPPIEISRFSGAEAGALLYFVFGLALLSLSRLMSLQTHWNRLHIPVSSRNLPRQWAMYSMLLLLLLAVFVGLLPAGDSLGFFAVLATLFGFILSIFLFLAQLLTALILFLLSLPFLLFGKAPPLLTRSVSPVMPKLPTQPMYPGTNSALFELVKSVLLWGSLIAIIVFSLIRFAKQHDEILAALRKSRITNWLLLAWQWLYRNVTKASGDISRAIAEGWQNVRLRLERRRILPPSGFLRLRALDPRRRVFFFYLAMIRRSAEQGLGRKSSQTPSEYAATLGKALPTQGEDIDSITDAFIQARYSRQEVDSKKANLVKETWVRIRRALQSKARREKSQK